jgi:hypothetical protein
VAGVKTSLSVGHYLFAGHDYPGLVAEIKREKELKRE